ncbi:MAG TPA: hypothetical protein VLQ29_14085 [Candidatus Dormibacteraeota bacterium]|jgi:hypothetical protein|nr:hypothetical protein [Candidatus Dormibacteraeota bacterium]
MITQVQDDVSHQDPSVKRISGHTRSKCNSPHWKGRAAALEDPAAYTPGGHATAINRDLSAVSHDLARLTAEWESVTATVNAP